MAPTSRIYIYLHIAGDNVKFIALFFAPFARQLLCMRGPNHSATGNTPTTHRPLLWHHQPTTQHHPPPTVVHKSKGKWLHFYDCAAIVVVHRRSPFALLRFYHTNISVIINAIKMKKYVVNFMCCLRQTPNPPIVVASSILPFYIPHINVFAATNFSHYF